MILNTIAAVLAAVMLLFGVDPQITTQGQVPRLMVESYEMDREALTPGEDRNLTVSLMNTHAKKEVRNIKVTLVEEAGEILCRSGAQLIPAIKAGEMGEVVLALWAVPSAKDTLHTVKLTLDYEDTRGGQYREETVIPVMVRHEMRLEFSEPQLPSVTVQGDTPSFSMTLMNMGKGEVKNALVTLEIPGLTHGGSVLAGNIPSGESREVKTTLVTGLEVLGETQGVIRITWEDAYGESYEKEIPVSLTIEKKPAPAPVIVEEEPEFPWKKFAIAMCAVSGILLITCIAAWVRMVKRDRAEVDRL